MYLNKKNTRYGTVMEGPKKYLGNLGTDLPTVILGTTVRLTSEGTGRERGGRTLDVTPRTRVLGRRLYVGSFCRR